MEATIQTGMFGNKGSFQKNVFSLCAESHMLGNLGSAVKGAVLTGLPSLRLYTETIPPWPCCVLCLCHYGVCHLHFSFSGGDFTSGLSLVTAGDSNEV